MFNDSCLKLFANVLQNRRYYKFPDIHKKISVFESLFNKVTGLMAFNFMKKRPQHSWGNFFYGTPPVAAYEDGWRISKNF